MNRVIEVDMYLKALDDLSVTDRGHAYDFMHKLRSGTGEGSVQLGHLEGVDDPNIWYGRVTQEMRAILWREQDAYYLLHIGRHDPALRWARRHKVQRHEITHALQWFLDVEAVTEVPQRLAQPAPRVPKAVVAPLAAQDDDSLLALGVPPAWLPMLRAAPDADALFDTLIAAEMPDDVQDRLFALITGEPVAPAPVIAPTQPVEEYPGATHRFTVVGKDDVAMREAFTAPRPSVGALSPPLAGSPRHCSFSWPREDQRLGGNGQNRDRHAPRPRPRAGREARPHHHHCANPPRRYRAPPDAPVRRAGAQPHHRANGAGGRPSRTSNGASASLPQFREQAAPSRRSSSLPNSAQ